MDTIYSNCRNILSLFIKVSQLCNFLKQCLFCGNPTYRFCTIKSKNITCLHCFYIQIFNRTIAETYINIVIRNTKVTFLQLYSASTSLASIPSYSNIPRDIVLRCLNVLVPFSPLNEEFHVI